MRVLYDTKMSKKEADEFAKKAVTLMLYKNKVSMGYCASIAEMCKEDFINFLSENGVSIFTFESEDEIIEEMNNA